MNSPPESIQKLASQWLAAEREAATVRDSARLEDQARQLSWAYDDAVRAASREELLSAWEAARKVQGHCELGSSSWLEARRVSELLRTEYEASNSGA